MSRRRAALTEGNPRGTRRQANEWSGLGPRTTVTHFLGKGAGRKGAIK
jgi:hypothetical protein